MLILKVKEFTDENMLDDYLSEPSDRLVEMMKRLKGDISILGIAGKMGISLGMMAAKAVKKSGIERKIYGVSRFSDNESRDKLEASGIGTIKCDLMDRGELSKLPDSENIIFMAGRKFGTSGGGEELTWAMNTILPANVAEKFSKSSIVVFSTGCVYPLVEKSNSCKEDTRPEPEGEYAQSCLGRERVFSYYSKLSGTKILIYRLNYSVDLRYGVLYDIAMKVKNGEPVDIRVPFYNAIWQGDACDYALSSLELCSNPPAILNVTGPEIASVKKTALKFGKYFGKEVIFNGRQGKISYLNDASKSFNLFGPPSVSLKKLIEWQAKWIMAGGRSLGKPTHFEVNNGKY